MKILGLNLRLTLPLLTASACGDFKAGNRNKAVPCKGLSSCGEGCGGEGAAIATSASESTGVSSFLFGKNPRIDILFY